MAIFAKVNSSTVTQIVVADTALQDNWIENTDLTKPAVIGGTYDHTHRVFLPLNNFPSWVFNFEKYRWQAPVAYPDPDLPFVWNESTLSWDPL